MRFNQSLYYSIHFTKLETSILYPANEGRDLSYLYTTLSIIEFNTICTKRLNQASMRLLLKEHIQGPTFGHPLFPPGPLLSILYMTTYFSFFSKILLFIFYYFRLGQVKTISGPSAAARTGQGAERRCQDRLEGRALRPHDQLYPCTKLIGGGGCPKIALQKNFQIFKGKTRI